MEQSWFLKTLEKKMSENYKNFCSFLSGILETKSNWGLIIARLEKLWGEKKIIILTMYVFFPLFSKYSYREAEKLYSMQKLSLH